MTAWVLPLRLPVSGVRPNKAHTGLGVMSFWKILEYAMNMLPQNELRLGQDQNMWMWSAGWLLQRGHEGSRSGNSFASLALVKCTLRTILSCINLCLAHGEDVCILLNQALTAIDRLPFPHQCHSPNDSWHVAEIKQRYCLYYYREERLALCYPAIVREYDQLRCSLGCQGKKRYLS